MGQSGYFDSIVNRISIAHLTGEKIKEVSLLAPTLSEQTAIAAYLDHKTAEIDSLIANKERLIELYEEEKKAVINQAVTKGLDPDAEMKDSGVGWLGDIPAHWNLNRLKILAESLISGPFGSSIKKEMYVSSGYRVYGQEQVIPANFSIGDYFITSGKYHAMQRYAVNPGDILISCVGSFGKIAVVPNDIHPGIINPRLLRFRPYLQKVSPEYLAMVLRSRIGYMQMEQEGRGGTMGVINIALLGQLSLPLPPKDEQTAIVHHIETQCSHIDAIISKFKKQIKLFKEYRTALISEAVTGKIDVRDN